MNWLKKLFGKKEKPQKIREREVRRLNNIIYQKDKYSESHIQRKLDEIFDKHHG